MSTQQLLYNRGLGKIQNSDMLSLASEMKGGKLPKICKMGIMRTALDLNVLTALCACKEPSNPKPSCHNSSNGVSRQLKSTDVLLLPFFAESSLVVSLPSTDPA